MPLIFHMRNECCFSKVVLVVKAEARIELGFSVPHWTWASPRLQTCFLLLCRFPLRFPTLCVVNIGLTTALAGSSSPPVPREVHFIPSSLFQNCRTILSCHYRRLGSGERHARMARDSPSCRVCPWGADQGLVINRHLGLGHDLAPRAPTGCG